ncbi:MAG TPA: cupredoxin domain-containing protein [Candidatus Limnocylindria bacterium]|nr:cupredoxin domain-containing protein [Candidatus Limnocylindria bacterium]
MSARAARFAAGLAFLAAVGSGGAASAAPVAGATVDVTIQNFVFSPSPITVDPGDTIRWTNLDSAPHSAVSVQPGFVTVTLAQGQTTTTTFDRPGTFDYVCGIHGTSMRGTVVVRGTPVAAPASPRPAGHIVDDVFQEARPDRPAPTGTDGALALYASAALALVAVARFAWVLRHP